MSMPKNSKKQSEAIASKMPMPKSTLSLDAKTLKAVEDWDVGEEYEIKLKVRMTGKNEYDGEPLRASLEVLKAEAE